MKKYVAKPIEVEAIRFDGTHAVGMEIKKLFPDSQVELMYEYGRAQFKLKVFNVFDQRYWNIHLGDFVVRGTLGDLMVYRENLFHETFERPIEWPPEEEEQK